MFMPCLCRDDHISRLRCRDHAMDVRLATLLPPLEIVRVILATTSGFFGILM
jgi:hypothetical protein